MQPCPFCTLGSGARRIADENQYAFVVDDQYPVTEGHSLIISRRHFSNFFEATSEEVDAIFGLLNSRRKILQKEDPSILGFNVGINVGEAAGQTIFHLHVHLIPRRKGDVEDPRGGIRSVIPGMQKYGTPAPLGRGD